MKKIFLILFASLFIFTQCGKDSETGNNDTKTVSISGKTDYNNGKSDIAIPGGNISWKGDESIFIAVPAHGNFPARLVEMKNTKSGGNAFQGEAPKGLIESGKNYEIWYFGNNGEGTKNVTNIYNEGVLQGKTISFKEQTGLLENIGDFHIAKGTVSFVQNNNTGDLTFSKPVSFETQMAIAYIYLYQVDHSDNIYNWDFDEVEQQDLYLDINNGKDYNTMTFSYNAQTNNFEQKYSNVSDPATKLDYGSKGVVDIYITTHVEYGSNMAYLGHKYVALLPNSKPNLYFQSFQYAIGWYIYNHKFDKDIITNQIYTDGYNENNSIRPIHIKGTPCWSLDDY